MCSLLKIVLIFFLSTILISVACASEECLNDIENREKEFEESDLVFLGRIVDAIPKNQTYRLEIIDIYKGIHFSKHISAKFFDTRLNTARSVDTNEFWIFYAKRTGINNIRIDVCGASRSLKNYNSEVMKLQPPQWKYETTADSLEYLLAVQKAKNESLKNWTTEIIELEKKEAFNLDVDRFFLSLALLLLFIFNILLVFKCKSGR